MVTRTRLNVTLYVYCPSVQTLSRCGLVKARTFQNHSDTAVFLFRRFRLDGIERSQDVVEAEGVLPYAVKGNEFYKHRLILRYLVPSNNYQFPNESLSQVELVITNNTHCS